MTLFGTLLKIEGKLVWKGLDILIFGILFPIVLATLFGYLLSKEAAADGASLFEMSYPAVITIGVLATGVMGVPLTIADYRHRGILRRFQVTPVSPLHLLSAQVLIQLTSALVSFLGVTAVYVIVFDYRMAGSWGLFLAAYALVVCAMYAIGIFIGSVVPHQKSANLWSSVVYFTLLLFSGTTIPYEIMPRFARILMDVLPLSHGIHLMKRLSIGESAEPSIFGMAVLIFCVAAGIGGALKYFKWT